MVSIEELISLKGKRSLITGAASGIGRAMAERFAEAGSDLILIDIQDEKLHQVRSELNRYGVKIKIFKVDLSRKPQIDRLWIKIKNNLPDILVNNAGIYPFREFVDIDEKHYQKVMDINLNSVFWMCQNMIKLRGKAGGTIVNVGSIEALLPFKKDLAHYSSSKAGVIALTRALANEHGRKKYKINVLLPGGIITEGTKGAAKLIFKFKKGLLDSALKFKGRISLGRLGEPDEVAKMALVMASDLSSYMSGAIVAVDGGFLSA